MKIKLLFFAVLMAFVYHAPLMANSDTDKVSEKEKMTSEEYDFAISEFKAKVEILREAKKLAETDAEKKALRAEIRDVKKEAKALKAQASGGIYLSTGAVIVIILLIILL